MWHEARRQERKIRGMLVDYRRRAERRRDFYEKIKADPTQFLQLHGRPCKIHLDSAIATAADSPATMMPWQGNADNLIDRFDVRAHLDFIPNIPNQEEEELSYEERHCNYERYRILAQNSFLGINEEKFLKQLHLEEQFGYTAEADKEKKKKTGAAIGFNYDDPSSAASNKEIMKTNDSSDDSDESDSDLDVDLCIDVSKIEQGQAHEMNKCGQHFGMYSNDFYSFLTNDMEEAENFRLAREEEHEKSLFSGRKSRRERRAHREKRLANRVLSPPSYAARDSPTYPAFRESKSRSKSPSPVNAGQITYITSFGDEEEPSTSTSKPTYADKVKYGKRKTDIPDKSVNNRTKSRKNSSEDRDRHYRRRSRSRNRSRTRSPRNRYLRHHRRRSRSRNRSRRTRSLSRNRRKSRTRSRSISKTRRKSRSRSLSIPPRNRRKSRSRSRSLSRNRRKSRSRSRNKRNRSYTRSRSKTKRIRSSGDRVVSRDKLSRDRVSSDKLSRDRISREKLSRDRVVRDKKSPSYSSSSVSSASSKTSRSRTTRSSSGESVKKIDEPPKPIQRYYGRKKSDKSSSETDGSSGEDKNTPAAHLAITEKVSMFGNSGIAVKQPSSSTAKMTPQERLKRKMQLLLNKQYKADKIAEQIRSERAQQEQRNREDELREMALKLRKKQRERRHAYDDNSSNSSSDFDSSSSSSSSKPRSERTKTETSSARKRTPSPSSNSPKRDDRNNKDRTPPPRSKNDSRSKIRNRYSVTPPPPGVNRYAEDSKRSKNRALVDY